MLLTLLEVLKPLIESITLLCEVGSRSKFKKILLPTFLFVENCLFLGTEVHHLVQFKKGGQMLMSI